MTAPDREAQLSPQVITFAFCGPSEDHTLHGSARRMDPPLGWELSAVTRTRMTERLWPCNEETVRRVVKLVMSQP